MAETLRITCTQCNENAECDDCLVHFFLAERDATVTPFAGAVAPVPSEPAGLPADLAKALGNLAAAGLGPEVIGLTANDAARAS
jgi:hypothetical protein